MQVNQKTIAKKLNLSTATVSKSLNNSPEIHPSTRAIVIEMATRLGYRPSSARIDKAAKKDEVMNLGLLIQADLQIGSIDKNDEATQIVAGMTEAASAMSASITIHYVPWSERLRIHEPEFQPPALKMRKLNGLILVHYFEPTVVRGLMTQLPCVTVTNSYQELQIDCVGADQPYAIGELMTHLYALGHRRIGYLPTLINQSWSQARFAGYVQSLARLGLSFDPAIANMSQDAKVCDDSYIKHIVELTGKDVTAWVCTSDACGYEWYRRFRQAGLRVPEDVSLVGVDDVHVVDCPKLTSIHLPFSDMGRAAVTRLIGRIKEPTSAIQHALFRGRYVAGVTTGPART